MKYRREFVLQVAHFNDVGQDGAPIYPRLIAAREAAHLVDARELYEAVLAGTHGHNLRVEVEFEGCSDEAFLVDDSLVSSTITAFDNWNLSVHPAFNGARATTENIVRVLGEALRRAGVSLAFSLRVSERDEITATQSWAAC